MLMDQNWNLSNGQVVTSTAQSTFTMDLLTMAQLATSGGVYTVPPNAIIGNATFFGEDLGIGHGKGIPMFLVNTGAASPTGPGGTTLEIDVQGAPDNGGGTIAGLTFTPYMRTNAIPIASIAASKRVMSLAFPRRQTGLALPRFINLNYVVGGGPFANLTLTADLSLGSDDAIDTMGQYASNY